MRGRDFYYGQGMAFVDRIITWSGIVPGVTLAVFIMMGWIFDFSDMPVGAVPPLAIAIAVVTAGVCYLPILFIRRWKHARGYNAWKATFEEDWTPRNSFVRRFVKEVRLPRGRKRRDQKKEHVNV